MTNLLTLIPFGGLANRLRAIASAIILSRKWNKPLEIIWFTDEGLSCPYEELFSLAPNTIGEHISIRNATKLERLTNDIPRKYNAFLPYPFIFVRYDRYYPPTRLKEVLIGNKGAIDRIFKEKGKTLIASCWALCEEREMYDVIIPSTAVESITRSLVAPWGSNVVGVHIRRTDHLISIRQSPTTLFIKEIQNMIKSDPTVQFFLATDSIEERERISTIFGERIFTPFSLPSRNTQEGIIEAFGEMLALSRTRLILGTKDSTFSEVAADIGDIPYKVLSIYVGKSSVN